MTAVGVEPVDHGGNIDAARRRYPDAVEPWIDLSTGVNPHPYPFAAPDIEAWTRLPQPSAELALREAAARRYGVFDVDMVVAAPGSQALIQAVPRLVEPTDVVVLGPTYAEHAIAWTRCGHHVVERDTLGDIGAARVAVVVNPNNPTGRVVPRNELIRIGAVLEQRRGLLVVDEAFADFEPELSLAPQLPPRAIVLRSFGKAYGLAGLRLGFALAHSELADRLRADLGPWSVSGPALTIGAAALADADWLASMKAALADDCRRLDALLIAAGFELLGGTHLFRLVRHTAAREFADTLGRHGICVRRFAAQPTWLRFGLPGSEPAWARLESALTKKR